MARKGDNVSVQNQAEADFKTAAFAFVVAVAYATQELGYEEGLEASRRFLSELDQRGMQMRADLSPTEVRQYDVLIDFFRQHCDEFPL